MIATFGLAMYGVLAVPVLGDYDAEPRIGEHVDVRLLADRLAELGANTYFWLIWHSANDWADLHDFLPLAAERGIDVWVYLVPPTETAHDTPGLPYSEPYRLDYVRWAEEIGKLSLVHANLVGYVIDDFWANVREDRFSAEYIAQMVAAGKAVNPKLKFYPLMYYPEFGSRFAEVVAPHVDGVVAAYPRDRREIETALQWLNDSWRLPSGVTVTHPWDRSDADDRAFVSTTAEVEEAAGAKLSFRYRDDYDGPTEGYHYMQVRLDEEVVWEEDVAGHDDSEATIDLTPWLGGRTTFRLAFGVYDRRGVSHYGVRAQFGALTLTGVRLASTDFSTEAWQEETVGRFTIERTPAREGAGRYRLPLIVMPAGSPAEYVHRHGEEGTPERVAAQVRLGLGFVGDDRVEGVVIYCLDKSAGSRHFEAVKEVFAAYRQQR